MSSDQIELSERLRAFMEVIVEEAKVNPGLARRISRSLGETTYEAYVSKRMPRHRRTPPVVDPFLLYEQGEDHLRLALADLDLDQLKDVVAGHGMDRARLALRWRKPERLIDLIVETVKTRTHKGEVFRS